MTDDSMAESFMPTGDSDQPDDWVTGLAERLSALQTEVPDHVRLVAVTKKFPASVVRAAYQLGLRDFGESQVQEALDKQEALADLPDIRWHLIGHLQSNKARKAITQFDWIHSVDSLKLAKRLDALAAEFEIQPQCCLQVKLVPDPPKYGLDVDELWAALPELDQLEHLKLRGLMTIPPLNLNESEAGAVFSQGQQLAEEINCQQFSRIHIDQLSMGMSSDYSLAIAAGSTMIRLGTELFGPRPTPPSP
jgi:pyridoxal phosphate enzyme (YggS family)